MKKIIFLAVLSTITLISCRENAASKIKESNLVKAHQRDVNIEKQVPVMRFDKREYDFGTIHENDVVETVFNFKNTGKTDLVITNAYASCGCTIPVWPKEPIKPGETGIIKVKFNSRGKKNKQHKTVTLNTNTKDGKELLSIRAQVIPIKKLKN